MISPKSLLRLIILNMALLVGASDIWAQSGLPTSCPIIDKRNNGNGQYGSAAGYFPNNGQHNPAANNVEGTSYDTVSLDPSIKTGNINFYWPSSTPITNIPVITRVWITASGSNSGTLTPVQFGPPPPPVVIGQNYYVNYCFYVQNIPPAGKITLEFTDPLTGLPVSTCTYDLQNNTPTSPPIIDCSPTISAQPANASLCGSGGVTFSAAAIGAVSLQWQMSSNNGATWVNITNGGNFSGVTSSTLAVANAINYDGYQFRLAAIGNTGCNTSYSNAALLVGKPKPTAVFSTTSYCGTGTRSIAVSLTGTAPWSITYTTTPSGGSATSTTASNITTSPYYFSVNPAVTTTYTITSVSDAYCSNSGPTGNITATINANPSITPSNSTVCYGSTSFNLTYSSTGSPNRYTLSPGVRAMPGFSTITNATLTGSPITITIPANIAVGVYDFNLSANNSSTTCSSASIPFTVTVAALPNMGASAASTSVCAGSTVVLSASPSGLTSYSWTISPSATVLGTGSTYTPTINSNTTYTVTGTTSNGCSSTATVSVSVTAGPTLSITPSAPSICNGNATILSASGGNTYSWSPATGLSATTGDAVVAAPTTTTTYTVTSANVTGCQSVGTVTVTVTTPTITVTPTGSDICSGSVKTLTATGGATYIWYPTSGLYTNAAGTTPYTGTSLATVYASPTSSTTYYVQGTTAGGCKGIATTNVNISTTPVDLANSVGDSYTFNSYTFCGQAVNSFNLPVKLTQAVDSMKWSYATSQSGPYTLFTSTVSPSGATFTPYVRTSPKDSTNLTVSGYSNGGYAGPQFLKLIIYGACTYEYIIKIYDTKASGNAPVPTASPLTICSGESAVLSMGDLNGMTIQWQSAATATGTYTNISGATSSTYVTGALTSSTNNYFRAVLVSSSGGGSCNYTTSYVYITTIAAASSNTVSASSTCTDGSTSISITGNAVTGATYQWESSTTSSSSGFSPILGAISQNYTLPNTIVPTTTWFRRLVTAGSCGATASNAVAIYAPISNNQISNTFTSYCSTAPAITLNGTTPVGGSGSYTYQWMSSTNGTSFSNISGATLASYTTTSTATTTYYQRVVNSGSCSDISSTFLVKVNPNPTVTVTAGSTVCGGTAVTLTAAGANSYSWSPTSELSSTTGSSVIATPTATRSYTVTGTDANGCSATATSTITVNALPSSPTLSTSSQTICSGNSINLNSKVTSGGTTQWYTAPEANAAYLVSSPTNVSTAGTYYAFGVSGSCYSANNTSFTLSVVDVTTPIVASTSLTYCAPATADLSALQPAPVTGVTYEWHTVSSNPTAGNLVSTPSAVSSGTYYLYSYAAAGGCYGSASSAVTVTISSLTTATVSTNAVTLCSPNTVNLNSYNTTGGTNTYNWYTSSTPSPATLVTVPTQVSQSGTYYQFATNAAGCQGPASAGVVVTINPTPTANISSPASVCGGETRTIIGSTDASNPSWQWQVSSNGGSTWSNISNGTPYSGVTTSTLTINPTSGLGGKYYRFIVSSPTSCSATSSAAILVEESTPYVVINPSNDTAFVGQTATFSVSTTGSPTVDYQWQVSTDGGNTYTNITEGSPYFGVNSSTLTITNVSLVQSDYFYKVLISTPCMSSSSVFAKLFVSGMLPVTWINFSGSEEDDKIILDWSTGSEENSRDFVVQHSMDGTTWEEIGTVDAAGFSTDVRDYSFEDRFPQQGINYYRLIQRDLDGRKHLSSIISVDFASKGTQVLLYPNPVSDGTLTIELQQAADVRIFSTVGALMMSMPLQEGRQVLDVSQLDKGLYQVVIGGKAIPVVIQ